MSLQDADTERNPQTGRTPEEERMIRFGYYAGMAADLLSSEMMAGTMRLLESNDYPVVERLREIATWCYDAALTDGTDHAFKPGTTVDGDPPSDLWCDVCGESRAKAHPNA